MKKLTLISIAAIAALVSCQKETLVNSVDSNEPLVFTASIADDQTKTTLTDDNPAKVYWESTDVISITDASNHTATYKLSSGDGTKEGTFTYASGDDLDASSTYTATYGSAPSLLQTYSEAGSVPLYMTAPATSDPNGLSFSAKCGVLRVTIKDASHKIMRVEVSDGTDTYKVTASSPVDISSETKFYIVLPAGTYTALNIYDDNDEMVAKDGISLGIVEGHIKPAVSNSLSFVSCTTKGFKGTHAWVQLWSDGPKWAETNLGAETETDYGKYYAWGYPTGYTYVMTSNNRGKWVDDNNKEIKFNQNGFPDFKTHDYVYMSTAAWGEDWTDPTKGDLEQLVNTYTNGITDTRSDYTTLEYISGNGQVAGLKITGKTDGYTSNYIFMPICGSGDEDELLAKGTASYYWSCIKTDRNTPVALTILLQDRIKSADTVSYEKYYGFSVRPVRK